MKRILIALLALTLAFSLCMELGSSAQAASNAPVAENMEFSTYRNVSFGGELKAYSPDDEVVSYKITTEPIKGSVKLNEDGSFVYTPDNNKRGRDYFGYKATDSQGRSSQEGTVIIRIEKQKQSFSYSDMEGRAEEYAAVMLSELNIFTGEKLGGQYCFFPERPVSRAEFITMCMALSEKKPLSSAVSTGYSDDADIPQWLKPYALSAAISGIDKGVVSEDGTAFAAEETISPAQAALILDRAIGTTDVSYVNYNELLDMETAQACANLSACGIIREGKLIEPEMSRAEAAQILLKAWQLINNR